MGRSLHLRLSPLPHSMHQRALTSYLGKGDSTATTSRNRQQKEGKALPFPFFFCPKFSPYDSALLQLGANQERC